MNPTKPNVIPMPIAEANASWDGAEHTPSLPPSPSLLREAGAAAPLRPPARPRRRAPLFIAGGVVLCAAAIAALWFARRPPATPVPTATVSPATGAPLAPAPPSVRGVTADTVTLGMSAAFSGAAGALGTRMKLGLDTAFAQVNNAGGVAGRTIKLIALDDAYDGKRARANVQELLEQRNAFALVGNVGTPTTREALPYVREKKTLFFGALTGAKVTRPDPPDDLVWNFRPGYEAEIRSIVRYLVDDGVSHAGSVRHVGDGGLVVFAQSDSYGDDGFAAVQDALRRLNRREDVLRVGYERGTVDVSDAIAKVLRHHAATARTGPNEVSRLHTVDAIVMVGTSGATAAFVQQLRDHHLDAELVSVSFVDAVSLADKLREVGARYCPGIVVTQVVPHPASGAQGVRRYRDALARYHPEQRPDPISLEGYLAGQLFAEALRRAGRELTTEQLVEALRGIEGLDLGIGEVLGFGPASHDASRKVWATALDERCALQPFAGMDR